MTDVKKVWNKFKRMAKNEEQILDSCDYSMTVKQIAKNTATIRVCTSVDYDERIKMLSAGDDDWSKRWCEIYKARKQEYGTSFNYVNVVLKTLLRSRAWDFLKNEVENIRYGIEEANGCYYIRVNY